MKKNNYERVGTWAGLSACCTIASIFFFNGTNESIKSAFYIFYWSGSGIYELIYGLIFIIIFVCLIVQSIKNDISLVKSLLLFFTKALEISLFCKLNVLIISELVFSEVTGYINSSPELISLFLLLILSLRVALNNNWKINCRDFLGSYVGTLIIAKIIVDQF